MQKYLIQVNQLSFMLYEVVILGPAYTINVFIDQTE